jgi:hypothetical protein
VLSNIVFLLQVVYQGPLQEPKQLAEEGSENIDRHAESAHQTTEPTPYNAHHLEAAL